MKSFAEKIKSLVLSKEERREQQYTPFDFVKTRKAVLKELIISKQSGNLLGLYSKALGEGMFLTGVEDIEQHGKEVVIVFSRYDMSGNILSRTRLSLGEIQMVCPFNQTYRHPIISSVKS